RSEVDLPAVMVDEGITDEADVVEVSKKIEERVAGGGNQYFVAGIAQQAKKIGVAFAGAGGEKEIVRRNPCVFFCVIADNRLTGGDETLRRRFVAKRRRIF